MSAVARGSRRPAALLLHGHYLGGWAWEEVSLALVADGWHVASPTLPGCGRGDEEQAGRVGLHEHVRYVSAALLALRKLSKGPLAVVAHSYSGLILQTLLGDPRIVRQMSAALFLDAALCQPGQSLLDLLESVWPGVSGTFAQKRVQDGSRGFMPPPEIDLTTEGEIAYRRYVANCGPAPWGTFVDALAPAAVAITAPAAVPRAYVRCEHFPLSETMRLQLRGQHGWREEVWPVGHLAMLSHPGRVVEWVDRVFRETVPGLK